MSSLLNKLTKDGSRLTPYDGATPDINPLATQQSNLHADASGKPGYSVNGNSFNRVNGFYQLYLDGTANTLPQPSQLDLNDVTPSKYLDNLPR